MRNKQTDKKNDSQTKRRQKLKTNRQTERTDRQIHCGTKRETKNRHAV